MKMVCDHSENISFISRFCRLLQRAQRLRLFVHILLGE
jgi:hypothetical protein